MPGSDSEYAPGMATLLLGSVLPPPETESCAHET